MTKYVNITEEAEIGARVKAARLLAGMSQEQLGDRLGVTFQQIQKYEKGANRVSASRLVRVAKITQQPLVFFLPESDDVATSVVNLDRADIDLVRRFGSLSAESKRALETLAGCLSNAA